jgi:hypothetical protein
MSHTPAAWLARLKVAFPRWSIQRVTAGHGTGFTAYRQLPGGRSQSLYAPTLAELEYELCIATRAGPPGAGADVGRPHHAASARPAARRGGSLDFAGRDARSSPDPGQGAED